MSDGGGLRRDREGAGDPVPPGSESAPDLDTVSDAVAEGVAVSPVSASGVPSLDGVAVSDAVAAGSAPAASPAGPRTEAPSDDVAAVPLASRMPGAPRDGYHQLPTAPVITATSGPVDGESVPWEQAGVVTRRRSQIAPWALGLAILALLLSFFVGWMLPLGVVAVIAAIIALRRYESRPLAIWALVLGAVAVIYSAGWLLWALPQLPA